MNKLIGALAIFAIGACMTAPANAVVVLTAGTPETVNLKLFSSPIQEIQFTATTFGPQKPWPTLAA